MKRLLKAVVISSIIGLFAINLVGCGEDGGKREMDKKWEQEAKNAKCIEAFGDETKTAELHKQGIDCSK